jgi:two-component system NtrC family sensor kinase
MTSPNSLPQATRSGDFPYFRRLWNQVVVALLSAAFLPLLLIGGGIYWYSASLLEHKTLEGLRLEVLHHQHAIDRFLAERALDLQLMAATLDSGDLAQAETLQKALQCLTAADQGRYFTDLGVIDDQGRHRAYVGPYELLARNYREADWFKAAQRQPIYISDVFSGFRNEPHFVIAVRSHTAEGTWFLRGTINAAHFESLVQKGLGGRPGTAFVVNRQGVLQSSPTPFGRILEKAGLERVEAFEGVRLEAKGDQIRLSVWQSQVAWLNVLQVDRATIFETLHRVRNLALFAFILGAILIVFTVLLTTNALVTRLETKRRSINMLDQKLRRAGHAAASSRLSQVFVGEIKDTLANIDVTVRWMNDLLRQPESGTTSAAALNESLEQIRGEVLRGRRSLDRMLTVTDTPGPMIMEFNLNALLDELLELFERELRFGSIKVIRDYQQSLPSVRSDPGQLRQVFQHLLFNAVNAIGNNGLILLKTRLANDHIRVEVTDDGPGIAPAAQAKLFDPLFSTQPEGMGLGLSVCGNILTRLGGRIAVESTPGKGASFKVDVPVRFTPGPRQVAPQPSET